MDFLQKQMLIYSSKKYENVYILLNKEYDIPYHKLFLYCAAIGARKGMSIPVAEKGREFRSNYFSNDERNLAYSIILNDEAKGKDLERFGDDQFHAEARKVLENYAEGGMCLLVEEVFREKWDGIKLDETYMQYPVDLIDYVVVTLKDIPF